MSSANLDLVGSIYAAWERGDFGRADWADPEIEFASADGASPGSVTGIAATAKEYAGWLDAWEDFRVIAEEYSELDDGRVLVLDHATGRGRTSGAELGGAAARYTHLLHVRDGKVTRFVGYFDRDRAFADLGLTPDTGT
jgi:ketosteroid isomerase-like protein